MSYLSPIEISNIKDSLLDDEKELRQEYISRKSMYDSYSESYNRLDEMLSKGWEIEKENKNTVRIRKEKDFDIYFEDRVWCFFYELGFRILNKDRHLKLKYGIETYDRQQIDVIAVNDDTVFIVECKASQSPQNVSYKRDLESISQKKDGYIKCIKELYGKRRVKLVLATENQSLTTPDKQRMESVKMFHLDDNVFKYMNELLGTYKKAATYQIMATFFKGEIINNVPIKVPALKGKIGDRVYYMFSIQPHYLLQVGFVSHRTRANKMDMPTYQRLIVPARLKSLNKFIEEENGTFPNSVIINFDASGHKLGWNEGSKDDYTSKGISSGTLLIPNTYGFAYIIDGQHRIYGYANTSKLHKDLIPVVAFENLKSEDQLDMFLSINQNQKAISKSLRITLTQDVYWSSNDLKQRMSALASGIVNYLGSSNSKEPLRSKLTVGEDKEEFSMDFFFNAIRKGGLIPSVTRNNYDNYSNSLYDISITDKSRAMEEARVRIGSLIAELFCYIYETYPELYIPENKLIYSNRANYALVYVLSVINGYLMKEGIVYLDSDLEDRWEHIRPFIDAFLEGYGGLDPDDLNRTLSIQGQAAQQKFAMLIMSLINNKFPEFTTDELESWKETQDSEIQDSASNNIDEIEALIKKVVLDHLEYLFGNEYHYDVPAKIYDPALEEANAENRANRAQGKNVPKLNWTDKLYIKDYREIIREFWGKRKEDGSVRFQDIFSFNMEKIENGDFGENFEIGKVSSKDKGTKWIVDLQSFRNKVKHRATRADGITKAEAKLVSIMFNSMKQTMANHH